MDLSEVTFVKRISVGTNDPSAMQSNEEIEAATALLNRCLSESPKGQIIGTEKSFTLLQMGEHQMVLQWIVYHVGFKRRPLWLE
ncbi:hypothetical protein [Maridesulfovibrio sp. FT414]|uniref:hypothetical protein n=1 Tax=Maridesulfovibrio sp. FT414 TaxID=2979469 RepID=UPI003D8032F0